MAALHKSVGDAEADDQGIVKLQAFSPPAQVLYKCGAKWPELDLGNPKNPLQEHDDHLDEHHQKARPSGGAADRVGHTLKDAHTPPQDLAVPGHAQRGDQDEGGDGNKKQFHRGAVIDEAHHRLGIGPIQPTARVGNGKEQVVRRHCDILQHPQDEIDHAVVPRHASPLWGASSLGSRKGASCPARSVLGRTL